jgi:hypothetical protein
VVRLLSFFSNAVTEGACIEDFHRHLLLHAIRRSKVASLLCCVARVGMLARPIHLKYSLEIVKARRLCMPLLFSDAEALLLIATSLLNFIQDPVHST